MIRDLSASDDRRLTAKCAVCVIGGGIAGLIAASRLSASGRRVIVLESGDRKPLDRFDAFNVVEQVGETYQNAVTGRVRALGGTSNTWGGRIMPLAPHDMAPRDYLGLSGWPIERAELDRFVPEIERLFRLDQSSYEELPPSPSRPHDPLPGGRQDMTPRWSKWPTFRRRNVAHLLRDMVAIKRNPEIWLNATVCDLLFDAAAGRLTGVEARSINGRRLTVVADWFVLAAGTFETTRLLLQLDELTDGRAFSGCDALGRYFNDHLKIEAGRIEAARQQANQSRFRLSHRRLDPPRTPPGNHRQRSARRPGRERLRYDTRRVSAALDPSLCAQSRQIGSGSAVPRACAKARDCEGSREPGPRPLLESSTQTDVF